MNAVSLFAGIGGFDLALERNGITVTDQVEIDRHARTVLDRHWPTVRQHEDIHDFTGQSTDIVVGGFPCQDYSVAGARGGLAGDRGALWWQMHRVVAEGRPTWVVGENVPGLLSSNGGADFRTIVGSLVELGYGVVWRVLDAQYFGVAQRRRRVFIVGHSGGVPRPEVLAVAEGCQGGSPPSREQGERTSPTLAARVGGGGGLGTDHDLDGGLIVPTLTKDSGRVGNTDFNINGGLIAFNWQTGGDGRLGARSEYTDALHVGQTPAIAFAQNQRDEVRDLGDRAGALAAEPGVKQQTYVGHRSTVRRLTPLECERLQGFPDRWTAGQSDTQRYRQLGNAVAVPVVEWISRRLSNAEG
jgi:DNA (cytosine-5)-methyltransferase 1